MRDIIFLIFAIFIMPAFITGEFVNVQAVVANSPPHAGSIGIYTHYTTPIRNKPEQQLLFCNGMNARTLYLDIAVHDANSILELYNPSYSITRLTANGEEDFPRFGRQPRSAYMINANRTHAVYGGRFAFMPEDAGMYRIRMRFLDRTESVEQARDFEVIKEDCSYVEQEIIDGAPILIDASTADATILISGNDSGWITVVSTNTSRHTSEGMRSAGYWRLFQKFQSDSVAKLYYYPAKLEGDFKNIAAYKWDGARWKKTDRQGHNARERYVWTSFQDGDEIALLYSTKACKPIWECGDWGECIGGRQTRHCEDERNCMPSVTEKRECTAPIKKENEKNTVENVSAEKPALFDIVLELPKPKIKHDENLTFKVSLFNFGRVGRIQTRLYYTISKDGKIIWNEEESVDVEAQNEFLKTIRTEGLAPGDYLLSIDLEYPGQVQPARTESIFTVTQPKKKIPILIIALAIVFILLILSTAYFRFYMQTEQTE